MNYKDIAIRSLKTFVQAFVPIIIVALSSVDITDWSASKSVLISALISACSAGFSAVWNFISQILKKVSYEEFDTNSATTEEDEDIAVG